MVKQLILIFFFGCLISSGCLAQAAAEVIVIKNKLPKAGNEPVKKEVEKKPARILIDEVIDVHFTTNENCLVKVNGKEQGEINKNSERTVRLKTGNYSFSFVSKVTNKRMDSSFKITPALVKEGIYSYAVVFKKDDVSVKNSVKADASDVTKITRGKDEVKPPRDTVKITVKDVNRIAALAAVNELSTNMVPIPAGSFTMGVVGGKMKGLLPHSVTIDAAKFGKYEVTQQQWETIMGSTKNSSGNKGCSSCPVENVSWNEVDSFILKINTLSKNKFRLPTEAEWEYVAKKALEQEIEAPDKTKRNVEDIIDQTAWYRKNSVEKTHPAGTKKPLSGVYDLLGNVAEWCQDFYTTDYQKENANNPSGPSSGKEKVVKGGSFLDTDDLKPAVRNKETPSTRKNTIGFRLVMPPN